MTSPRAVCLTLNPPFEQQWAKDNGGDKLTIKQSHAGSSKQALAILQGLKPTLSRLPGDRRTNPATMKAS